MADTSIPVPGVPGKALAGWDIGGGVVDEFVRVRNALVTREYDAVEIVGYTDDDQPLQVIYRANGVTVATLTMTYAGTAGGNLLSVTRT